MLKVKLNALIDALNEISVVASSVTLNENQRTVVILEEDNKLYFYATSTTSNIRYQIDNEDYSSTEETFLAELRIKELSSLVGTLNPETSEYISLDVKETRIDFSTTITSSYGDSQPINVSMNLLPVPPTIKDSIKYIPLPEKEVDTEILSVYLEYLLPSLDSVEKSLDSSKMMFGSEAVFTLSGGNTFTYMKSQIPEEFEDVILGRTSLLVLQSMFKEYPSVKLMREKNTNSLVVMSDKVVAVCSFKKLSAVTAFERYVDYVEQTKTDNYIGFDRIEFLDILKRLAIFEGAITLEIKDIPEPYSLEVNKDFFPKSYIEENHPYLLVDEEENEKDNKESNSDLDLEDDNQEENNISFELDSNSLIINPTIEYVPVSNVSNNEDDESLLMENFIKENTELVEEDIQPVQSESKENISVTVKKEIILKSSTFSQSLPVLYSQGVLPNNVKVTMKRVEILRKSVLGSDSTASQVLLLGISSEQNTYGITLYDSYELWFSYFSGEK